MAAALRIALVLITLACVALFLLHPWWFPAPASAQAPAVDHGLKTALWVLGGLFIAGQIVLALFVGFIGPKRSSSPSRSWYGNWRLEIGWTAAITAIFFWFNISGGGLWSRMTSPDVNPGALRVEVTGVQFQWYFRYPGPDGVFGRVDAPKFARPDEGNPLGLDPGDPAGKDDIVSSTLVLPAGRPVELDLRAHDVIHSVFIPAMRLKQDAVPGMDIRTHFTPTEIGNYELVCSQLCGLGHYRMKATVRVVSEEEFKGWFQSQGGASDLQGPHLKALYDGHRWFELRDALRKTNGPAFYRGASACAFGDLRTCEKSLNSVIGSAPHSAQSGEAHAILEAAYLRTGQYKKALSQVQARLAINPDDEDAKNDYALLATLGKFPDQSVSRQVSSRIPWEIEHSGYTVPLSINGRPATYAFDTGAGLSVLSESEAKRLGLTVQESGAKSGNMAGGHIAVRTAVADELAIGEFRLRHVAFLVFRDDQEPFASTPAGRRGLIGLPVMLALGTFRWNATGSFEIGFRPLAEETAQSNLCFDGGAPATEVEFQDHKLPFFLDTGAEETYLFRPFAEAFPSVVSSGKKESQEVMGVGQTKNVDSLVLPEVQLRVGGLATSLRSARVLLHETGQGSLRYSGNLGVDLLRQAQSATFDFKSMTLTLK
jgi:heme/copper-type cytochrome/quinol oxidase subunit 2